MIDHKRRWFIAMTTAVALAACSGGGPAKGRGSGGATMSGSGGATMAGSGGVASRSGSGGSGGAMSASGGSGGAGTGGTAVIGMGGSGGAVSGSGGRASGGSGGPIAGSGGTTSGTGASGGGGGTSSSGGALGSGGAAAGGGGDSVGSGGAAGSTGGAGGAGSPCGHNGSLFCDDFEKRAAGPVSSSTPWVPQIIGSGTLTIDTTTAHSGGKSLHVHAGDDDYDTLLAFHDATVLPAPQGKFYARAFIRLGRAMATGHNSYLIADPFATPGSGNNVRIGEDNGMLMYTISGDSHGALSNANYYTDHKPGVVFAPSTWVCLELLIDASRPELDVWVDGAEIPDLHHTDWPLDSYDTLRFGFEKYAGPGIDIWYDDIAIGTARIGCQ